MSTLLQRELRDAMSRRDAARARLDSLATIVTETTARMQAAAEDVEVARQTLREAAGDRAVEGGSDAAIMTARKRLRSAVEAFEIASAESEGVAERLAPLEREVEQHERHISRVATRIAVSVAADVEREALDLARSLGRLLATRQQLARFAQRHSPDTDPLGALDQWSAFRRSLLLALGEPIPGEPPHPVEVEPVTLESLSRQEPEAAAAE
jgi:chromosome segregation ATPase